MQELISSRAFFITSLGYGSIEMGYECRGVRFAAAKMDSRNAMLFSVTMSSTMQSLYIILHDLRSVYNVGAIFRTADAIGADKIYLSGTTPTPLDRFGKSRPDFAKSALGSEQGMSWEYVKNPSALMKKLHAKGFQIIAVEQTKDSIDYKKVKPKKKVVVVFGNEVKGVSKLLLKNTNIVAEIPMRGKKESLNVSVAAGIVLFRWFDR